MFKRIFDRIRSGGKSSSSAEFLPIAEISRWRALLSLDHNDRHNYVGVMALSYACATRNVTAAKQLLEKDRIPASGVYGLADLPLYALIDYNKTEEAQLELAALLKKYNVNFKAWDLDKHIASMTEGLCGFIYRKCSDEQNSEVETFSDSLLNLPKTNGAALTPYQNVLALSYACLTGREVEMEFMIRVLKASPKGCRGLEGEPLRAAQREKQEGIIARLAQHGVRIDNSALSVGSPK